MIEWKRALKSWEEGNTKGDGKRSIRYVSEKRFFIRDGVSKAICFPSFKIQTLSPISSASSMFYVDIRIEYFFLRLMRHSQTLFLEMGSKLAVGSSNIISFASPIRAIAIEINLLFPALSFSTFWSKSSSIKNYSDNSLIILGHFSRIIFRNMHVIYRCSLKVSSPNRKSCYWQSLKFSLASDID